MFELSCKVLNGRVIELQELGKGKRSLKADPLSEDKEEELWRKGILGSDNPISLNYTIFFLFSQYFGTRGRQEHRVIQIKQLKRVCDVNNGQLIHIEWVEGPTKTCQGGLNKCPHLITQKIFRTGGVRCPIAWFEKLVLKRPLEFKDSGPLYLTPLRKERNWTKSPVWYSKKPLGEHSINNFICNIAVEAGFDLDGEELYKFEDNNRPKVVKGWRYQPRNNCHHWKQK